MEYWKQKAWGTFWRPATKESILVYDSYFQTNGILSSSWRDDEKYTSFEIHFVGFKNYQAFM